MRNLILLAAILFMILSCSKNEDSRSNIPRIVIKGIISGSNLKSTELKSGRLLSLSDAKKVLVFNSTSYQLFNIEGSSFTAEALSGTATALAFLDEGNRYIGCLCAGGLNVLPLVSLKNGDNTVIDLRTLTLDGTSVIPANNPIGDEIILNEEEIAWYKELGVYYESLSKNIDADNDGVPDILNKKNINISTLFFISCGSWGLNDSLSQIIDTSNIFINYVIRISGGKSLIPLNSNIVLTGPETLPYNDIKQTGYSIGPDCFIASFSRETPAYTGYPFGSVLLPFQKGTYSLTLDNKNYTLNYSNISAKYFCILAKPTIQTNDKNEIISVSIEYRDMQNNLVTAENFVFQTQVTLEGIQDRLCQIGALWENPEAKTNTDLYNFKLPTPIPLSELRYLSVMYVDLIGNSYNIGYTP
ncbi:MAG: hypothetical protein EHM20_03220 [Alphaproteobacteria bacterium]|nr:MAG: hypothetical protein EHM20_03220 [Alphaproteobacteria bacterium]